jgi:ribosomal protein S18 acetylase RimI-like enzyme
MRSRNGGADRNVGTSKLPIHRTPHEGERPEPPYKVVWLFGEIFLDGVGSSESKRFSTEAEALAAFKDDVRRFKVVELKYVDWYQTEGGQRAWRWKTSTRRRHPDWPKATKAPLLSTVETDPKSEDIRFLEDSLNEFNVQSTGISNGKWLALFYRAADGSPRGGAFGWTWGGTCYIRYLYLSADIRNQGHGTRLIQAVEAEAKSRGCHQIVLETHDFQAPGFYQKLGFEIIGRVPGYPRDYAYLTLVKRLD